METLVSNTGGRRLPDRSFWRGRRVALTGHTGFKGAWLSLLLTSLGAKVYGYALPPNTEPSLFTAARVDSFLSNQFGDVREASNLRVWLKHCEADVVLHLAAQALVRESYRDPCATMTTNFNGTLNVLETVRHAPHVKSLVIVTTDKVYRNLETSRPYDEEDALGGHDPYSASKAAAEILSASYAVCFLQDRGVATARAGNVIGGGDWSADRLIPDAIRAWHAGESLSIRRPEAVRPWQHVLEPICAYLVLAESLYQQAQPFSSFNFGPASENHVNVRTVVDAAAKCFGGGQVDYADDIQGPHEAGLLCLNVAKAEQKLAVVPHWNLTTSIEKTISWYRDFYAGCDPYSLCMRDIESFLS